MSTILSINERLYPVGGSHGMERAAVTVVLVAGEIGDYAAYMMFDAAGVQWIRGDRGERVA